MGSGRRLLDWLLPPAAPPDQVSIATAGDEPQAALICERLRSAGIEGLYRSVGGGVGVWAPWNPSGPREIVVNARDAERAIELLRAGGHTHHAEPRPPSRRRARRR